MADTSDRKCQTCPAMIPHYTGWCEDCHKKIVARIHQHDTPTLEYKDVGKYVPLLVLRGRQRRVIRKSEPMAG
jgi:hypothetical protein